MHVGQAWALTAPSAPAQMLVIVLFKKGVCCQIHTTTRIQLKRVEESSDLHLLGRS